MAYFEFTYFDKTRRPVVADMYANAEDEEQRVRIGRIFKGTKGLYVTGLSLPGVRGSTHKSVSQAASEMLLEANLWLRRLNLSVDETTS